MLPPVLLFLQVSFKKNYLNNLQSTRAETLGPKTKSHTLPQRPPSSISAGFCFLASLGVVVFLRFFVCGLYFGDKEILWAISLAKFNVGVHG